MKPDVTYVHVQSEISRGDFTISLLRLYIVEE